MERSLAPLMQRLGHDFADPGLLETALTHSSHANERDDGPGHNERLEFLGDAVLELAVSEALYRDFPDVPEGVLTLMRSKLVSEPTLAELAQALGLNRGILLGKGEENQGGRERPALLSDALEAVFGAIFLDAGFEAAAGAIRRVFAPIWPSGPLVPKVKDHKSRLQEYTQKRHKARPTYVLSRSFGPEHDKRFEVRLTLPDGGEISATGKSVKKAEQRAARLALEGLAEEDRQEV